MKLKHWSAKPITLDNRTYPQRPGPKPKGLWFDCNGEWQRWCQSNEFRNDDLRYCHELLLSNRSKILWITNTEGIDQFTKEYSIPYPPYGFDTGFYIDWPRVAEKYDGIIINPYNYERRLDLMWYYGWDCASGCIWNINIIQIKLVKHQPKTLKRK